MNQAGYENKAGELLKEIETLVQHARAARNTEAKTKIEMERAKQNVDQLQARLYKEFAENIEIDWNSPNPVLDENGMMMPEFEAQWRQVLMNNLVQEDQRFQDADERMDKAQDAAYNAQSQALQTMTELGVKKVELRMVAALLEVSGESG